MGSTFFGLNTALTGLTAQQRALNTVTHNLTNASTEGYSRQRVTMAAAPAFAYPALNLERGPGQIGTGVEVKAYSRMRDQFLDVQYRTQNAQLGQWSARSDSLARVDTIINEPGESGLSSLMQDFWRSWQALSQNPESASARESVRSTAQTLISGFHDLAGQLEAVRADADTLMGTQVARVNELAGQINLLNQDIAKAVAVGQEPNDVLDARDRLLDELSRMANVSVTQGQNGKVFVAVSGALLVDASTNATNAMAVSGTPAVVTVGGTDVTAGLSAGSIRGLIDVRDTIVGGPAGYIAQLDALAAQVVGSVNAQHQAGFGLDGVSGRDFLQGTSAATIGLSAAVTASLDAIAASGSAADVPGGTANAVALAQLQRGTVTILGDTTTLDGYYQSMVSRMGVEADRAFRLEAVHRGVTDASAGRRDAVSGVNLDEEVADMVRFQKSYNAAARMVTAVDEMLDLIVNRMGMVGR
jgi:flagellar hook-associated protein 1 FlgK